MSWLDYLLLAVVGVLTGLALRHMKKKKTGGCCGNCENCSGCSRKE